MSEQIETPMGTFKSYSAKRGKTKIAVAIALICIALVGVVAAAVSVSFTQNPVVPALAPSISLQGIVGGSDQTAMWTWNETANSFTAFVTVQNDGNAQVTPTVTATPPNGWTLTTSQLAPIAPQATEAITLTLHYTNGVAPAGAVGAFTITVGT